MKILGLVLCLFFSFAITAQRNKRPEFDKWVFSYNSMLDFSTGVPTFENYGSAIAIETASSICNSAGEVIFYSDGREVYDATHAPMPNSSIWNSNSTQDGPLIVPFINDPNKYYLFQVDGSSATFFGDCGPLGRYDGLYYHVVDMSLNAGLGDIVPGEQNISLVDSTAESVIGIMHENGRDYWVITRKAFLPIWYAYLVTEDGVCPEPVITDLTGFAAAVNGNVGITPSFDQNQIATAERGAKAQLIDFDRCTGKLGEVKNISPVQRQHYDVAFSPNDSLIYLTHFPGTAAPTLFQYERFVADIPSTQFTIGGSTPYGLYPNVAGYAGLRVYGDTLYIGNADSSLHILSSPNNYGDPGLVNHWIYTAPFGSRMSYNFPNYFDYHLDPKKLAIDDTTICLGDALPIGKLGCDSPDFIYEWSPSVGLSDIHVSNPTASPSVTTTYVVTMTFKCMSITDTVTIAIAAPAAPEVGVDTTYCYADPISDIWAYPGSGGTIQWWGNADLSDSLGTGVFFEPTPTIGVTTYYATETTSCTSEPASVTITVKPLTIETTKVIEMETCESACNGSIILFFTAGTPPFSVNWFDDTGALIQSGIAITTDTLKNLCSGNYTVIASEIDLDNCPFSATYTIMSAFDVIPPPDVYSDTVYCLGEVMSALTAIGDLGLKQWYLDSALTEWIGTGEAFMPLSVLGETIYYVIQANDDCASLPAEVSVTIEKMNLEFDEFISNMECNVGCNGEIVLNSLTGDSPFNIRWYDAESVLLLEEFGVYDSSSIESLCAGEYSVIVEEEGILSCVYEKEFVVNSSGALDVNFTGENLSICKGNEVVLTNLTDTEGINCIWNLGNGFTSEICGVLHYTYPEAGVYDVSLSVTDENDCEGTLTFYNYVNVFDLPVADFYANESSVSPNNPEVIFTNTSIGGSEYSWNFGDQSDAVTTFHAVHNFPNTALSVYMVQLTVTSDNGCIDSADIQIQVNDELVFYVPNVFTPDGNNTNEFFQPVFYSGFDPYDFHLSIYNRWGELIFESYDANVGWNGNYLNGDTAQDGVYIWSIEFKETMSDKRHLYRGHVTLMQ